MKVLSEMLSGVKLIKPTVFEDERGYFFESYHAQQLIDMGIPDNFVQDNQSLSHRGVLRGLHFQHPPVAQGKLVRVIKGSVLDVVVDIRKNSKTFGHHFSVELNESNKLMLWVPVGFAHGFCTLEDHTVFSYKCTEYYKPNAESGIKWNDKNLNINWVISRPILSEKDQQLTSFNNFESPF